MNRMEVKIIYSNNYEVSKFQEDINKFIKNKTVIDIKLTSEGAVNGHSICALIMYITK